MIRVFIQSLALMVLIGLAGGYADDLHPLGASLAVLRPALAVALIPLALAFRGTRRLLVIGLALMSLLPILWSMRPQPAPEEPAVTLYQKNLLFRRGDHAALVRDFRDSGADIILLEELSINNMPIVEALKDSHPHQLICTAHSVGSVAILSKFPLTARDCREGQGFASARVDHPSGAFTAAVLHLHWPYPYGQKGQVDRLLPVMAELEHPVILGGDFNMIPWAGAPRRIARATNTVVAGPLFPTLYVKGYPLPIDHVLVPADIHASLERRPKFGSDHYGVLARIGQLPGRDE